MTETINQTNRTDTLVHKSLFNRSFVIFAISYIISAFANGILRFAMPLYILYITESPAIFGIVTAVSTIPMILLSPVGGFIADRFNKKRMIITIDVVTAVAIGIYLLTMNILPVIPLTLLLMMVFFSMKGMMEPVVDSAIPLMVPEDRLASANSISVLITMLSSSLLGPAIGGILFAAFGIREILIVGVITFAIAVFVECFMVIPSVKQKHTGVLKGVKQDFKESITFITKTEPIIIRMISVVFGLGVLITPIIIIGVPVLVTGNMGLDSEFVGFALSGAGIGGLIGGMSAGAVGDKLKIKHCFYLLIILLGTMLLFGLQFLFPFGPYVLFGITTVLITIGMALGTMFSIITLSFIQKLTPSDMLGKVLSLMYALTLCGQPIGALLYGSLFQLAPETPWAVILGSVLLGLIGLIASRKVFHVNHVPAV